MKPEVTLVFSLISCIIAIIGSVLAVLTFASNRKDKSNKDGQNDGYKWGQIDAKLENIGKTLYKIEGKFDTFYSEMEIRINKAIEQHEKIYHKKG